MHRTLDGDAIADLRGRLDAASPPTARRASPDRQPLHTYYLGAQHFTATTVEDVQHRALSSLADHAPDPSTLAEALGLDDAIAGRIRPRLERRLTEEPVVDLRLDFEDGLGRRTDAEEDELVEAAAAVIAEAADAPRWIGLRIKALAPPTAERALRTLDGFVTEATRRGGPPAEFLVTVPKVEVPEQAAVASEVLERLERHLGLGEDRLRFEIMIETVRGVVGSDGTIPIGAIVDAAGPRLTGVHFGTYDYTTSCGIAAAHQHLRHGACDFARMVLQNALAATGVWLSDGSTARLPVGDRTAVHAAWRRHFDDVTNSLIHGFYQGWDLHPAQLVTRYAANFVFFEEIYEDAAARLARLIDGGGAVEGDVLDDPATGEALLGSVRRAVDVGAVEPSRAAADTGLTAESISGNEPFRRLLDATG